MSEFSQRLRDARLALSMTQEELAKAMDVSKSTISMWENGNRVPSIDVIIPLSNVLKVTPGHLSGDTVRTLPDGSVKPGSAYREPIVGDRWDELYDVFDALSIRDQEQLIRYGRFLLSQGGRYGDED